MQISDRTIANATHTLQLIEHDTQPLMVI